MMGHTLFAELLRMIAASGEKPGMLSCVPSAEAWYRTFEIAKAQSLIGICFSAIERLPAEQRPPKELLLAWYGATLQIENQNKRVTQCAQELCGLLRSEGFKTCLLKGQGVALYYPNPLRRQSGDIDMWIRTADGSFEADRIRTIRYVRSRNPQAEVLYHHIDFEVFGKVPVELHFMPTWLFCRQSDKKLQRWFEEEKKMQFSHTRNGLHVPTDDFNAVFLLLHIAKHIFESGVGLRQIMDYYYMLASPGRDINVEKCCNMLKDLGVLKVARAVMYVLQEVFGLDDASLLCRPDARLGRFLLEEIMISGNMGFSDPRHGSIAHESPMHKFCRKQTRIIRFFSLSPKEVLWSPLFSIYHRLWRWRRGYL